MEDTRNQNVNENEQGIHVAARMEAQAPERSSQPQKERKS